MSAAHLARTTDPAQSHEAAARSAAFTTSHRGRILAALRVYGPMTAHELAERTELSYVQIDRRMHELVKARQARATGATRPTPTGGRAAVWEVV